MFDLLIFFKDVSVELDMTRVVLIKSFSVARDRVPRRIILARQNFMIWLQLQLVINLEILRCCAFLVAPMLLVLLMCLGHEHLLRDSSREDATLLYAIIMLERLLLVSLGHLCSGGIRRLWLVVNLCRYCISFLISFRSSYLFRKYARYSLAGRK